MRHSWSPKGERKQKCDRCGMKLVTKQGARGGERQYYDSEAYSPRKAVPVCNPKKTAAKRRPSKTARR